MANDEQRENLEVNRGEDPNPGGASIRMLENGPLVVTGLRRIRNQDDELIPVKEKFSLCRCGGSSRKPFCDGSHRTNGFNDQRELDRPIDRYRRYDGESISVDDNRTICAHVQYCIHQLPSVFDRTERPWIAPDGSDRDEVINLTHRCPSGALRAMIGDGEVLLEGEEEMIVVHEDGPYELRGSISLEGPEELQPPIPSRYTLCRCGSSRNRPYCDGSHLETPAGWGSSPAE